MSSADAKPFLDAVRIVLGLTSSDQHSSDSLLTSLHCELTFNDLRDSCRRGSKKERQAPPNFHAIAMKSASKRSSGCKSVDVTDDAWAMPLQKKQIQSSVHSALRMTDRTLGIPTSGLTKCKAPLLTKPHILVQRLGLLKSLQQIFEQTKGPLEDKRAEALKSFHDLWISKLFGEHTFMREKSSNQDHAGHPSMVLRAGPFNVLTIALTPASASQPELYTLSPATEEITVTCLEKYELCPVEPVIAEDSGTLAFRASGEYLSLAKFTAMHGILRVAAGVLRSLCARLKIRKSGNLTHRLRVELFLKEMQCTQEYIAEILDQIPENTRKRKRKTEEDDGDEQHDEDLLPVEYMQHFFWLCLPLVCVCV